MKQICRIHIPLDHKLPMHKVFLAWLDKAGVTMQDIEYHAPILSPPECSSTHYGNWVVTPVLDNEKTDLLCLVMGTKKDMCRYALEYSDLEPLNIHDKVSVQYTDGLAHQVIIQGEIVQKSLDAYNQHIQIVIRVQSGNSRRQLPLQVGDEARVDVIDYFTRAGRKVK